MILRTEDLKVNFQKPLHKVFSELGDGANYNWKDSNINDDLLLNDELVIEIKQKLEEARKKIALLQPLQIDGVIKFWLVPDYIDLRKYKENYGIYTVEELNEWIENKGPIPIIEEQGE